MKLFFQFLHINATKVHFFCFISVTVIILVEINMQKFVKILFLTIFQHFLIFFISICVDVPVITSRNNYSAHLSTYVFLYSPYQYLIAQ